MLAEWFDGVSGRLLLFSSIFSIEVCYALLVEWFDGVSGRQVKKRRKEITPKKKNKTTTEDGVEKSG